MKKALKKWELMARVPSRGQGLAKILGMKLVSAGKDGVRGRMPWSRQASQAGGLIHGGALAALADTTAGVGTIYLLEEGWGALTTEMKINYFGNISSGSVESDARLLHRGKRNMVWEVRITPVGSRRLLAIAIASYALLRQDSGAGRKSLALASAGQT
jgi:uncharacterized protein (TIGR00369 family)